MKPPGIHNLADFSENGIVENGFWPQFGSPWPPRTRSAVLRDAMRVAARPANADITWWAGVWGGGVWWLSWPGSVVVEQGRR
eukprot:CAMPEP_0198340994 /NCGR_PEP_ID=MMETSP1450-20131203/46077_1 /TAXON_ID=753684 ORGANISM="Madagascaria erythrocladiodes, Strain CCMP3234" /NCGR_SAMPLE_ID=MMETSP1450 /ASSEMBLY_ACC=CAM_ASM_001115 /LENGTH=81 /DNA_ID=CAMNT_0044045991 /DNA_START=163 /DNA_END=404 /DNA_ORIENTATION=+